MLAQTNAVVLTPFRMLLSSGGLPLLAFGLFFSLWAIWNVIKPPQERWILAQIMFSLFPGVIALIAIYMATGDFAELATSQEAPKPPAIASAAGRAMSYGFFGLLSTIVPIFLGAVALLRKCNAR